MTPKKHANYAKKIRKWSKYYVDKAKSMQMKQKKNTQPKQKTKSMLIKQSAKLIQKYANF